MGQCCGDNYEVKAEEFINLIVSDPSFKLNAYPYNELLNALADIRSQHNADLVSKTEIEKLSKKFYVKSKEGYHIYYMNIIKDIMFQLESPKTSMYKFILYLYPFINHEDEECDDTMYYIFKYLLKTVTAELLLEWINKYIIFCTQGVTHSVWEKCEDHELASALDELNTINYSRDNIKRVCYKIKLFLAREGIEAKDEITFSVFQKIFKKWDLSSISSVREFVTRDM
ncbi:MAG: hypothetical protein MJ252_27130 [archaeon]|nr:hypothetical protein [archaeon]